MKKKKIFKLKQDFKKQLNVLKLYEKLGRKAQHQLHEIKLSRVSPLKYWQQKQMYSIIFFMRVLGVCVHLHIIKTSTELYDRLGYNELYVFSKIRNKFLWLCDTFMSKYAFIYLEMLEKHLWTTKCYWELIICSLSSSREVDSECKSRQTLIHSVLLDTFHS